MATRNIVPRADGEGKLGTPAKKWGEVHAVSATVTGAVSAGSVTTTGAVSAESVAATGAVSATGITTRQNSTAYALDDVAFTASIPGKLVLVCTTAGTTAASEPDMSGAAAGGTVTDGTVVWTYTPFGTLSREITPAFNKRDVITTSGTYTAPVDGWYKITIKGGGGGGGGSTITGSYYFGGGGGGEGGETIAFEHMTAGDTSTIVIGGGGAGGSGATNGADGGNSTATLNANTYTANGGEGGSPYLRSGNGGTGTIPGAPGGAGGSLYNSGNVASGSGGGNGGGTPTGGGRKDGISGGGGAGAIPGGATSGAGGDGYVWLEYFDATLI